MSSGSVKRIVERAVRDAAFRADLQRDPARALAGTELSAEERAAITSGDPARLSAMGIDQRMSKAFAFGLAGDVSKTISIDPGSTAATLADEPTATQTHLRRLEQDYTIAASSVSATEGQDAFQANLMRVEQDLDTRAAVTPEEPAGQSAAFENEGTSWRADHLRKIEQDLDVGPSQAEDGLAGGPELTE